MKNDILISLLNNAVLLLAIATVYDLLTSKGSSIKNRVFRQILTGIVLGVLGIGLILTALHLKPGIIFDTRSVLLSLSGLFFGLIPTLIAMAITAAARLIQGGAAAWTGVAVVFCTGSIGLLWRHLRRNPLEKISIKELYLFGIINHVVMLVLMFLLPLETALSVVNAIGLPVLIIYPLVTVALGLLLTNRLRRQLISAALVESEATYRKLFNNNHTVMLLVNPETGEVVDANPAASRFYGWTSDELRRMKISQINTLPPEEIRGLLESIVSGQKNSFPCRHRLANGSIRDVEVQSGPLTIGGQHLLYSIIQDVTARSLAEAERAKRLAETEQVRCTLLSLIEDQKQVESKLQLTQFALDHSSDAVFWVERNGTFSYVNDSACQLLGYTKEELLKLSVPEIDKNFSAKRMEDAFAELNCTGTLNIESTLVAKDGRAIPVEIHDSLIQVGSRTFICAFIHDITERKRMQDVIEKRIVALTRPLDQIGDIAFNELFNLEEIQRIQDEFAAATGVASLILHPDGTPITKPSNFCRLCMDIIRKTERGCANCKKSDATIGMHHPEGPIIQPCMSGGLWDAGVTLTVGGKHVASWLIGQVRDETQTDEKMRTYAQKIGVDEEQFMAAYREVPIMSRKHFQEIAQALFTLANQLSTSAYQNIQQARFISEQKIAEDALRESHEYLDAMWGAMDVGILLIDAKTRSILRVNPAILEMSGYREEELIGQICHHLVCPADEGKCPVGDLGHAVDHSERKLVCADGHQIDVEKSVTPITMNGREVYVETLVDVTERKKTEAELQRLSTAIEQSPETVLITNSKGLIEYVNPAFETITGYAREEVIGKTPRILRSGQHDTEFYSTLWKTIISGNVWNGRFINKRKDGILYTEEAAISPVRDRLGAITGYVAVKRDITDELVRDEQFRQSQKMEAVGQLAGGVAHDFNNILQAILGFSEILLNKMDEKSIEHRNVIEIEKAARRAANLTQQLLAFSRKQSVNKQLLNLNSAVHDAEILLHMLLGESIQCTFDLAEDLYPIHADAGQLTQIVMNLAVNARDSMPEGGRLAIATENITVDPRTAAETPEAEPGSFVCLAITDTGTGMTQQVKDHLFEPFFTTKTVGKGTGLGLAVVYGIVKQSKGWIRVNSEPGQGTTFNIYLPAINPSDAPLSRSRKPETEKILLVDDDPDTCDMVLRILNSAGYTSIVASSAEEALSLFEQDPSGIDLLFSDVVLPGKNGIELANIIRKKTPALPVLLYSGYRDPHERWKEIDSKGYVFLQKPFSVTGLLATVHDLLNE
ncbi:MAG: PAS domain S-box protein [Kiritimatiellales bacterium]|nr:PAS domain S-box protein [Kiritimatiellales bacterium]